jgi:hypothetical protein
MRPSIFSLLFLFSATHAVAGSTIDFESDFKCGMSLSRAVITSANFYESGENLLVIPSTRAGQRGFYSLAASGAKYHALPPERAFKKNAMFYYHIFALEDPKTKKQARIVYSDIISSPDEAITMTMGAKDKREFPLSAGVPVNDQTTQNTLVSRFKLSLQTIPQMIMVQVQNDGREPAAVKSDIRHELSQILCTCKKVSALRAEVQELQHSPALAPYAPATGCGGSAA